MNANLKGIELQDEVYARLKQDFPERGFSVLDNFITENEVSAILARFRQLEEGEQFRQAGVGKLVSRQIATDIRGDVIRWIEPDDPHPAIGGLVAKTTAMMQFFREYFYLPVRDLEMHYTEYPAGRFYKRHSDCFRETRHRLVSFVYYFNMNWQAPDGGELRLYGQDGFTDISPQAGRVALFRSDLEHEVLITNRTRYSITGWMLDKPQDLTFL